ncbi:hypothetical protein ACUOA5_13360, partial [Escherichia coli]
MLPEPAIFIIDQRFKVTWRNIFDCYRITPDAVSIGEAPFLLFLAAWGADKLWPLPLHEVNPARVVVAQDGTPLWRFADADGIWRYPVTISRSSAAPVARHWGT